MSDVLKNLTNLLGEDKIPDNIKEMLNQQTGEEQPSSSNSSSISPEMLANLMQMFQSSSSNGSR